MSSDDSDSDTESYTNENNIINELTNDDRYSDIFNVLVQAKVIFLGRNDRNGTDEDRAGRRDRAKHIVAESLLENGWTPNLNRRRKDAIILNEVGIGLAYLQGMVARAPQANRAQIQNYINQIRTYIATDLNNDDSDQDSDLGDNGSETGTPRQPYNAQGRRKRKSKKSKKSRKSKKSKKSKKTRKSRK